MRRSLEHLEIDLDHEKKDVPIEEMPSKEEVEMARQLRTCQWRCMTSLLENTSHAQTGPRCMQNVMALPSIPVTSPLPPTRRACP